MAGFLLREVIELIGIERATGRAADRAVVWCGLHDIDWQARQCDAGYWVRTSAQRRGFSLEGIQRAANLLHEGKFADRYCYGHLDPAKPPPLDVQWGEAAT